MPSFNHSVLQFRLSLAFSASQEHSILPELTIELPTGQWLTPDISVLPKTAIHWLHDTIRVKTVPLLAVEIPSPTQGFQEIADKIDLYFKHGVQSVWVVQSAMQAIAIYLPGTDRPQVVTQGEARDPSTGLTARLETLFAA